MIKAKVKLDKVKQNIEIWEREAISIGTQLKQRLGEVSRSWDEQKHKPPVC